MKLYSPVNFPFADALRDATLAKMEALVDEPMYILNVDISQELRDNMNAWLNKREISNIANILSFKRNISKWGPYECHVDARNDYSLIHASLIIPVEGCKNTAQYWYKGPYTTSQGITPSGAKYSKIEWSDTKTYLGKVEIAAAPVLARVAIPHGAYSRPDEYRTTVTIRFEQNESFEYLVDKLSISAS